MFEHPGFDAVKQYAATNSLLPELTEQMQQGWAESLISARDWFDRAQYAPLSMGRAASVTTGVAFARAFLRCFFPMEAVWVASSNLSDMACGHVAVRRGTDNRVHMYSWQPNVANPTHLRLRALALKVALKGHAVHHNMVAKATNTRVPPLQEMVLEVMLLASIEKAAGVTLHSPHMARC